MCSLDILTRLWGGSKVHLPPHVNKKTEGSPQHSTAGCSCCSCSCSCSWWCIHWPIQPAKRLQKKQQQQLATAVNSWAKEILLKAWKEIICHLDGQQSIYSVSYFAIPQTQTHLPRIIHSCAATATAAMTTSTTWPKPVWPSESLARTFLSIPIAWSIYRALEFEINRQHCIWMPPNDSRTLTHTHTQFRLTPRKFYLLILSLSLSCSRGLQSSLFSLSKLLKRLLPILVVIAQFFKCDNLCS